MMNAEKRLKLYLYSLVKNNGSDLHLKSGAIPRVRIDGVLKLLGGESLDAAMMEEIAKSIVTPEDFNLFKQKRSFDFTYILDDTNRFRVNFFYQIDGISAVFRLIPIAVPSIDSLRLPEVVKDFTGLQRGLVLVTGVTGSGKSTTLAAMIEQINQEQKKHIITIEDPIEFVYQDKGCLINQRAIGQHAHSFSEALRAALREDPDIIMLGEMRDLETIDIALHAANTGHLVLSTIHTLDAKETIDRIIGVFEKEEQNRIRNSLASVLEGVISQRLLPAKEGGRVVAVEVLKKTARIEQLIMENSEYKIPNALFEGREVYGTQTFDQSLLELLRKKIITADTALEYASSSADMKLKIEGIGKDALVQDQPSGLDSEVVGFKDE